MYARKNTNKFPNTKSKILLNLVTLINFIIAKSNNYLHLFDKFIKKVYNLSMNIFEIIECKKNGNELSTEQINFFVNGVCSGLVKDFQATSLMMAICLNGMTDRETVDLTMAMANSGEVLDLSDVGVCVDKHSTGGVSDTTTLVVVPILASLGVKVAKMSGRSLGFTGGTADKMEVFKGYKTEIDTQTFKNLIAKNNASIVSPSQNFAVADKILYKLRSQSGTVENKSLIASSIMSKKIASGAKILILDCKFGSGAFMKTYKDAHELAELMVKIGNSVGIKTIAILSDMNQPLTEYVGNNFEVYSALKVLQGRKNHLQEVCYKIAAEALVLDGKCKNFEQANKFIENSIQNGSALQKLKDIVTAQGGSVEYIENPELLLKTKNQVEIFAKHDGYICRIDTSKIGNFAHLLQMKNGIMTRQDDVGIILGKMLGDKVKIGEKLATIYYNDCDNLQEICNGLENCFEIGNHAEKQVLIKETIR